MTQQEIIAMIQNAINEVAPGKVQSINDNNINTSIRELGIDSVASMEMVSVVEETIGVNFPDDDLAGLNTLNDLVALVVKAQG